MNQLPIIEQPVAASKNEKPEPTCSRGRYCFVSLGCPKNLVDSERMLGLLQLDGYQLVPEPADADFVVVNTCGFIEVGPRGVVTRRSDEMLDLQAQRGDLRGVIVSGLPGRTTARSSSSMSVRRSITWSACSRREEVTKVADRLIAGLDEQRLDVSPRAGACIRPTPERMRHHAAALCLPQDLGRLRPALHVLCDPQDARQARHQTDRRGS